MKIIFDKSGRRWYDIPMLGTHESIVCFADVTAKAEAFQASSAYRRPVEQSTGLFIFSRQTLPETFPCGLVTNGIGAPSHPRRLPILKEMVMRTRRGNTGKVDASINKLRHSRTILCNAQRTEPVNGNSGR